MPKPLATQLYTFRDTTKPGIEGMGLDPATLSAIAEIGVPRRRDRRRPGR